MTDEHKPMEYDYPVSEYYKNKLVGGETVTKTGIWWTAILLIQDPKTQKPFVGMYRWQKTKAGWKTRKRFTSRRKSELKQVIKTLQDFSEKLEI